MTELLHQATEQPVLDTKNEIFAREVEEVLMAYSLEVIRTAAEVGSRLPYMGVVDGELVAKQSLREQILQRLR